MNKHNENLKSLNQKSKEMIESTNSIDTPVYSKIDMSDAKEAELPTGQVGYKDLFDNMPSGCAYYKVIFDKMANPVNFEYVKVNFAYEKNIGRSFSGLIGKRVTEVFPHLTETSFEWIKAYMKVALLGEPVAFTQYLNRQEKWYSIYAYSPQHGYVVAIGEDITERKQIEAKREQYAAQLAERNMELNASQSRYRSWLDIERVASLGTLASGVAHKINQPLQALKIMVDGMVYWYDKGKETSVEKVISNCRYISVQASNITSVVEWMQDFVNTAWSDTLQDVDLNAVIKQALSVVQERMRTHGIQLHEKTWAISLPVWGDIRMLEEIMIIILVNAIESLECADQAVKEIVVTTSCVGHKAVMEISNNGPAIPESIVGKIFEPFFASSKSNANLGIGLAVVKPIVDAYNGTIEVSSVHQQVTFRIEFPIHGQ